SRWGQPLLCCQANDSTHHTAALRDFSAVYVRFGSKAADKFAARDCRMSALCQKRINEQTVLVCPLSAKADSCIANKRRPTRRNAPKSQTSSARISIGGGIVSRSFSIVFLLMTRRKRFGCSKGRSPGRPPLRIRSARPPARS